MLKGGRYMRALLRFLLAAIMLVAAGSKFLDLQGFTLVLRGYAIFPDALLLPLAIAVTGVELLLAFWLFWGRYLPGAALVSTGLHSMYAIFLGAFLLTGRPILNCGCFGTLLVRPLTWESVAEDLVLVALSLVLYLLARSDANKIPEANS